MPPPKAYLGYRAELRNELQAVIVNRSRQIVVDSILYSILMLVYGRGVQYGSLVADDDRSGRRGVVFGCCRSFVLTSEATGCRVGTKNGVDLVVGKRESVAEDLEEPPSLTHLD